MEHALFLLAGLVLGATVYHLAVRLSRAESASLQQYSRDVTSLATESLASNEREITRDRSLAELAKGFEALNVTVGNLYLNLTRAGSSERTVLSKPLQVGEAAPGSPSVRVTRTQQPLPPEGLESEPRPSTTAAAQNRASALPAHT